MYAFPNVHDPKTGSMANGMTLRDYFAAKFIHPAFVDGTFIFEEEEYYKLAKICYSLADAMMKVRDE